MNQKELKELLRYNPETGKFTWTGKSPRYSIDRRVGNLNSKGYYRIRIRGLDYMAHRLAWLYVYGEFPSTIDHINGQRGDNRIINLRDVSLSENQANAKNKHNGAWFSNGRWVSYIRFQGKNYYVGKFKTQDEGKAAYQRKFLELHGHKPREI